MRRSPWLILFIAWLGWVFDIMDTALYSFAKVPMFAALHGPDFLKAHPQIDGQIQAIFVVGWAIGGLVFGVLADRWSRSKTLALTVLLYASFTGLTAFCHSWEQVAAVRFLTALGIGGEWAAGAALVAEAFSDKFRPTAAAILQTAAAFGPWMAALLNILLLGRNVEWGGFQSWQLLFLVGILPAIAAFFMRLGLPHGASQSTPSPQGGEGAGGGERQPLAEVFGNAKWRTRTLLLMVVGTVGIAGAGNATFWLPNLVKDAMPGAAPADVAATMSLVTTVMHVGTLVGVFLFPYLAGRLGRKASLSIGFVGSLIMTTVILFTRTIPALLIVMPLVLLFVVGLTSVFGLYFPELFPSRIRATGAGFGYNTARILQAPVPILTGMTIGAFGGNSAVGVGLAGAIYVIGLVALRFLPETRDVPLEA